MNLVVIADAPEVGERCAAVIGQLTGRHPSRTLIVLPSDPDGPSWVDAEIQAHCVLPRDTTAEACSERIYLKAGGELGRHLHSLVAPLLIHDLPVTVWWPGRIRFRSQSVRRLLSIADRLVVDGTAWPGDGLTELQDMASLLRSDITICDFALIRQSRWREAIASTFDHPELLPFLRSLQRITVVYAAGGDPPGGPVNIVRPLYHVAWLASRLRLTVVEPLRRSSPSGNHGSSDVGWVATLRAGRQRVHVRLQPEPSTRPRGRTLRVELEARRRGVELRVVATADADAVLVEAWRSGELVRHRRFLAPRRTEVDMLSEVIESVGLKPWTDRTLHAAAALVTPPRHSQASAR